MNFILDKNYSIPNELNQFKPTIKDNSMIINYDKKAIQLKTIINILNRNNIIFNEINTQESDLEDVFIELTK